MKESTENNDADIEPDGSAKLKLKASPRLANPRRTDVPHHSPPPPLPRGVVSRIRIRQPPRIPPVVAAVVALDAPRSPRPVPALRSAPPIPPVPPPRAQPRRPHVGPREPVVLGSPC